MTEVTQSCPTLCDPTDCSLPSSSVHGIFQARVLEWGAVAFSTHRYISRLLYIERDIFTVIPHWNNTMWTKTLGFRLLHIHFGIIYLGHSMLSFLLGEVWLQIVKDPAALPLSRVRKSVWYSAKDRELGGIEKEVTVWKIEFIHLIIFLNIGSISRY